MLPHHLQQLQIHCLRNLESISLTLSPGGNFFFGANGAGKTSVLEAVHFLSTGRSFRAGPARSLITHEREVCRVVGRVSMGSGLVVPLGIERQRDGVLAARVAGQSAGSLSLLAERLPVVVLDTETLSLVTGAPEGRRKFLDGTVFHVEQSFLDVWRRYQRALKQRNAGLRHGTLDSDSAWRDELVSAGEMLTAARQKVVDALSDQLRVIIAELSPGLDAIALLLRQGWESGKTLTEALNQSLHSDQRQGFTQSGPHRADLRVLVAGRPAADVLSRGQLKVVVSALRLAQGRLVSAQNAAQPVYLIDDLVAELDADHANRVCETLASSKAQVLMTAVEPNQLLNWWQGRDGKVFHVEQGKIFSDP
jgi:DNA replication and repair protein RecF